MDASPVRTSGFGALLRTRRLDRGLTQEDLAERAGISVRAVGDLERGRTFPRRHTVGRLCEALQLDEETRQQLITLARTDWAARQRPGASPVKPAVLMTPEGPLGLPLAVPAQLPWDVPGFVGRDPEIGRLLADPAGIWVIDGLAGIGKTALAVHVGHLLASRFPDGQLCLDLRGFDLRQPPVPPSAAIGYFLHALGMDQRLPAIADKLTAMFRTAMAGRRMLVILDNAASTEQVSALLPGASECLVLVTSRYRLSGLAARHGARRITLHSLDSGHAVALLTGIAGPELTRHDPGAPAELARLCGGLPLALRIAAERARTEATPVMNLIADLEDEHDRLNLLMTDDDSTSVRAVFSWSYHALEPFAAKLFRLASLHPGPDFTVLAAAALADAQVQDTREKIGRLADAHLIEQSSPHRFYLHDLMRAYAAEQSASAEPAKEHDAAVRRLLRWYLAAAVAADRQISPHRFRAGLEEVTSEHQLPVLRSYREAVDWFDAELGNLVAIVRLARAAAEHAVAWRLAWALTGYLDLRRPWDAWLATHRLALQSARDAGEPLGEAAILTSLGLAYYYPRLFAEAEDHYRLAQPLWRALGERRGEAAILNGIANIRLETRQLDAAIQFYQQALAVNRAIGDLRGEGVVLANLAETHCELGQFDKVFSYAPAAIQAAHQSHNRRAEVQGLCHLARATAAAGTSSEAEEYFVRAVQLAREADDRHIEAWALDYFGTALVQADRPEDAILSWQQAAALFDSLHDPQARSLRSRLSTLMGWG